MNEQLSIFDYVKPIPVTIKGICDDAYCPICNYRFDERKGYERDCKQCSECNTFVDWSPWYRCNKEYI